MHYSPTKILEVISDAQWFHQQPVSLNIPYHHLQIINFNYKLLPYDQNDHEIISLYILSYGDFYDNAYNFCGFAFRLKSEFLKIMDYFITHYWIFQ